MKIAGLLYFQCPVSLVFVVTGLNPILSEHLGVFVAIASNLLVGLATWYFLPRYFPRLELD